MMICFGMQDVRAVNRRARAVALGILIGGLVLVSAPLAAQEGPGGGSGAGSIQVDTGPRTNLLDAPVGIEIRDDTLALSLEQAVEIALRRNLALVVERYGREQAELTVFGNRSIYDLLLESSAFWSDTESATASTLDASQSEFRQVTAGLTQTIPTGGSVSLDWTNSRSETNLLFSTLNPSYDSNLSLGFSQPLLRNLGRLNTERQLRIAKLDSRISLDSFEQQVITTVQSVESAYWALVDAREQLKVAEESLELAQELHERNKIEVEVGTRAPLELVQSEATIATREEDIIRAQQTLGDAEDDLRLLLNLPTDLWSVPLDPTTGADSEPLEIDLDESLRIAYGSRPEIRSQQLSVERAEIDAAFFRNQKKPNLVLGASYALDGTAGDGPAFDEDDEPVLDDEGNPVFIDDDLNDAIRQILDRDFVGWSVSLNFSIPIQNRAARASSLSADLAVEEQEVRLEDLRRQILTEVRAAVRQVRSAAQQIASAEVSRRLQERNLDAEQKRYENGMSTSFQVTEIQEDLTQARTREVTARTAYRVALANYRASIGRLLDQFDIAIVDTTRHEDEEEE